jgi:hypothetical protein
MAAKLLNGTLREWALNLTIINETRMGTARMKLNEQTLKAGISDADLRNVHELKQQLHSTGRRTPLHNLARRKRHDYDGSFIECQKDYHTHVHCHTQRLTTGSEVHPRIHRRHTRGHRKNTK